MRTLRPEIQACIDSISAIAPMARADAAQAERDARLTDRVVDALHDAGVFKIFFPTHLGGSGLSVTDSLFVTEAASRVDGSVGWCATIGAGIGLLGRWLEPASYEELAATPRPASAATLGPFQTQAHVCEGGLSYTGRGTYGSCSSFASHVFINGPVFENGAPRMAGVGPEIRIACVSADRVKFLDTWHVTGLAATASHDHTFENVVVEPRWTFPFLAGRLREDGQRRGPSILSSLAMGLAAVPIGIARHALDCLLDIANSKVPTGTQAPLRERPQTQLAVGRAEALLQAARAYFYEVSEEVDYRDEQGITPTNEDHARVRLAAVTAQQFAIQAVDLVYETAGMNAIQTSCDIERCWRDAHAATRHFLFDVTRYPIAGRVYLGLEPGVPFI